MSTNEIATYLIIMLVMMVITWWKRETIQDPNAIRCLLAASIIWPIAIIGWVCFWTFLAIKRLANKAYNNPFKEE